MRRPLAVLIIVPLAVVASGSARTTEVAGKYVLERSSSDRQSWLELRTFPATTTRALTPRPVPGERRTDCCAAFSPDGSKLAFLRRTQLTSKLLLLDLESSRLRTIDQLRGSRNWDYVWARDGRSLLYATYLATGRRGIVRKVPVDGAGETISSYANADGATWPTGTSPDGSVALVVESRGPPLYFHYVGPDVLYAIGGGKKVRVATSDSIGNARWSPAGDLIAYSGNCYSLCALEVVRPAGTGRRRLTRFKTRTSLEGGYDEISFSWAGKPGELVYGRGRTLHAINPVSGSRRRIRTLPCPKPGCVATSTTIAAVSHDRSAAFVWVDEVRDGDKDRLFFDRLYRVSLLDGSFVAADALEDASDIWFTAQP